MFDVGQRDEYIVEILLVCPPHPPVGTFSPAKKPAGRRTLEGKEVASVEKENADCYARSTARSPLLSATVKHG